MAEAPTLQVLANRSLSGHHLTTLQRSCCAATEISIQQATGESPLRAERSHPTSAFCPTAVNQPAQPRGPCWFSRCLRPLIRRHSMVIQVQLRVHLELFRSTLFLLTASPFSVDLVKRRLTTQQGLTSHHLLFADNNSRQNVSAVRTSKMVLPVNPQITIDEPSSFCLD